MSTTYLGRQQVNIGEDDDDNHEMEGTRTSATRHVHYIILHLQSHIGLPYVEQQQHQQFGR